MKHFSAYGSQYFSGRLSQLTLPDCQNVPARIFQVMLFSYIPLDVEFELARPESAVCLGHSGSTGRTPMPEAPIDEHRELATRKRNIGATGSLLPVKSVATNTVCP